ncbi:hypothetical protein BGW38_004616, partial [Lunasporangiospora selenospora]
MNSTQYGYHPYPSPSQTQQQQTHPSESPSMTHAQQQQQQQLSPQQSPTSTHQQSPEQQHMHVLHSTISAANTTTPGVEQLSPSHHSPVHSNEVHSPIDTDGELVHAGSAGTSQAQAGAVAQQQPLSDPSNPGLQSPIAPQSQVQGHHPSNGLLPMPSPDLDAATAANTAANTNMAGSRQLIIQQYQQQQQQEQHGHNQQGQQQLTLAMSMPMQSGSIRNGQPAAINTAMMSLQGPSSYMLPSPQSAQGPAPPPLPTMPPQSTDLDTILAKYANQPELLKLIIASKTEEDRRWAEEARLRMMDMMIRGENRGLGFMAGYEALGGMQGTPASGMMNMNPKRFMDETGFSASSTAVGHHNVFGAFAPTPSNGFGTTAVGVSTGASSGALTALTPTTVATTGVTAAAGLGSMYTQSPSMGGNVNPFGMGMGMGMTMGMGMNGMGGHAPHMMNPAMGMPGAGAGGFGQFMESGLVRKRSVTFAGEVHQHMRSQSLSSIPTPSTIGGGVGTSTGAGNGINGAGAGMTMLGGDAFSQHHPQGLQGHASGLASAQQYPFQPAGPHPLQQGPPPLPPSVMTATQQQHHHQQQQQGAMHFHHAAAQPPLPPFAVGTGAANGLGGYSTHQQSFTTSTMHGHQQHHSVIRRTNSLSQISRTTVTEQRLVAARPRNDSTTSMRAMDNVDSEDESDDDYDSHPLMGMASRPGSALSIHNNIGGTGETSLTLEFSGLSSVSAGDHDGTPPMSSTGSGRDSIMSPVLGAAAGSGATAGSNALVAVKTEKPSSGSTLITTVTTGTKGSKTSGGLSSIMGSATAAAAGAEYKRKRKRREMQPVNQIVESDEPYQDPYLWKNNGNTTQKKTGCKSIYYKCSNSTSGCTVNKT